MLTSIYASYSYYPVINLVYIPCALYRVFETFASDLDTIETVASKIALSVLSLWRQHALTIIVLTEISRSKREEASLVFLYLGYTLLEPNFSDFHDILRSSEVAVMAASGRKRILRLVCTQVNLILWLIS